MAREHECSLTMTSTIVSFRGRRFGNVGKVSVRAHSMLVIRSYQRDHSVITERPAITEHDTDPNIPSRFTPAAIRATRQDSRVDWPGLYLWIGPVCI